MCGLGDGKKGLMRNIRSISFFPLFLFVDLQAHQPKHSWVFPKLSLELYHVWLVLWPFSIRSSPDKSWRGRTVLLLDEIFFLSDWHGRWWGGKSYTAYIAEAFIWFWMNVDVEVECIHRNKHAWSNNCTRSCSNCSIRDLCVCRHDPVAASLLIIQANNNCLPNVFRQRPPPVLHAVI